VREISEKQAAMLKAVTARALKAAGGAAEVQTSTRVNEATLSKYGSLSEDNAKTFVPIDIAVEIDLLAQSPIILGAMAGLAGFALVPLDAGEEVAAKPLTVHDALVIANEAADVVKAITEALANDGNIDGGEERVITREIDQLLRVMQDTLRRVKVRRGSNVRILAAAEGV
jgi:hypothetical protein